MGRITLGFNRGEKRGVSELASVQLQKQQPRSASSVTGVGRFCNGIADSERITPKLDELDNYNSVKCWESSDLLTRRQNHINERSLFIETENLCYNKKKTLTAINDFWD
jgi:hypothetical protein